MQKPNRSFAKKVFAAGLAVSTALWATAGLFVFVAQAVEAHPAGTLVLSGGTVWHISNDGAGRHGIDSMSKFQSHRFDFADVVPANSADLALPDLGLMAWGSGVLFNDGGTVYQVSGGMRHGFTSAANFTGNGFSFASVVAGSTAGVPSGANIDNTSAAHLEGTFVVSGGTVWMITATGRKGVPSPGVLFSYGASFSDVVAANAADLALANEGNATFRTGALVNDGGTIWAVTDTARRGFPTGSCYTGFGFNFSMPVAGSTSGLATGSNYCADTTTPPVTPPTTSTGNLSVSLAGDTPAASTVLKSASRAPFTKVQLTATGGDVVIDTWVVERKGVAADSSFASVDIIDLSTNATLNETGKTFSSEHTANFTEDLTVKSGTTRYVMLSGNIAASPGAGETPILALKSMTLKGGSLSGSFPIQGNAMAINTTLTIGTATVQRGAYSNASSTTIEVGKLAYTFFSFQIQAGSVEDVGFSQVKVYQSGTASLGSDLANIKLYRDSTLLADGVVSGNFVNFSFAEQVIPKGQTFQYVIKADVVSGSDRTVKLAIWRVNDIYVTGKTYNSGITPTYSGASSANGSTATLVLTDNQFTISVGTFRVGNSTSVAAQNIAVGTNQTLGAFEFEILGEPMIITAVTLTVATSTAACNDDLRNCLQAVRLVDPNGNTVAGPTDITSNAVETVAWTDTFTAPIGLNHYKVVGNLTTSGGWSSNDTITVSIQTPASAITARGEVTGLSVTPTPSSNTTANQQTVKAADLTVTKNSTPTNKTIVANATNVLIGSWQMDATNSGEDIRITSIAVRASTTGKLNTLTLKKVSSAGGTVLSTLSPVNNNPVTSNNANTTSTFALTDPIVVTKGTGIHLDLYGNVPSNVNSGEVDAWGLTDTTAASNASVVAYGVTTGNRATVTLTASDGALLTIAAAGTLTIDEDATSPTSRLVLHGSTGTVLSEVRLKATNESIDITVMNVRVADGGLTGTASGDYTQVKKLYLKLDGTLIGNTAGYSLGAANTTLNFERGQVTIPEGVTGKKLSIVADIVEIGTNQPGTANGDIAAGLNGKQGFTAFGNGSNTAATETYNDSTGSSVILHRSVPSVAFETPTNNLTASAVLHRVKISAVGNTIGLYRLSYDATTSTGVTITNAYPKLVSCGSCGGVADGTQLANTSAAATVFSTPGFEGHTLWSFTLNGTAMGKNFFQVPAGATAVIELNATIGGFGGTTTESVSTALLGDTATTTNDTGGSQAAGFGLNNQGDFSGQI
jgi:hypothetical protein